MPTSAVAREHEPLILLLLFSPLSPLMWSLLPSSSTHWCSWTQHWARYPERYWPRWGTASALKGLGPGDARKSQMLKIESQVCRAPCRCCPSIVGVQERRVEWAEDFKKEADHDSYPKVGKSMENWFVALHLAIYSTLNCSCLYVHMAKATFPT
jgi:hypothetical protein